VTVDLYGHLVPSANIGFVDKLDETPETTPQKSANQPQTPEQGSETPDSEALQVMEDIGDDGGPGASRTPDQRFRKPLLYPSELQGLVRDGDHFTSRPSVACLIPRQRGPCPENRTLALEEGIPFALFLDGGAGAVPRDHDGRVRKN
jgi:hypothetical protein